MGVVTVGPARATASGAAPAPQPQCVSAPPAAVTYSVTQAPVATNPRLVDLTFDSTAVDSYMETTYKRPPHVYVLEPSDYNTAPTGTKWPVIYLLHGHGGSYQDWVNPTAGNVQAIIDNSALAGRAFVVMPDGGYDGFYSDWLGLDADGHNGSGASGATEPLWQQFHMDEVMPWIDSHFPVATGPADTAIAGLSMGGFGAMSYAALYPGTFGWAGEFSGAVDSDVYWPVGSSVEGEAVNLPDGKAPDNCIWGDPVVDHAVWEEHDPTALAADLGATENQGIKLYLASGNGAPDTNPQPGEPAWSPGAAGIEQGVYQENYNFDRALVAAGITPSVVDFYPYGTHDWFYWRNDLAGFLSLLGRSSFPSP